MNDKENMRVPKPFVLIILTFTQNNVHNCVPLLQISDKYMDGFRVMNSRFKTPFFFMSYPKILTNPDRSFSNLL